MTIPVSKAFIFDCFGVIITDAFDAVLAQLRMSDPTKADRIVDIIMASNKGFLSAEDSRAQIAELLSMPYDTFVARLSAGETKDQRVLAYIASLRPRYKTALLSNVSGGGIARRFTDAELSTHFDVVVASGDIGYAKPEAQAYEITAERLGIRLNECVMIDDREMYCTAARGVGMQAVQYHSFEQMKQALEERYVAQGN